MDEYMDEKGCMNEWRKIGKRKPIMLFCYLTQVERDLTHVGI